MVTVMDKLADMHGQMNMASAVVIFFKDEESVGIQNCLDKVFVCFTNICAEGSVGDEILSMLFK